MAGYQHVVFATDLTDAAENAGRRAAALAGCGQGRLTLLHVVESYLEDSPVTDASGEAVADPQHQMAKRADEGLAALAERLGVPDVERKVMFAHDAARQGILEYANAENPDLIVLGTLGHPGKLGATADVVASYAPCDVLIVQGGAWQPAS